jgi:hypothetical protein
MRRVTIQLVVAAVVTAAFLLTALSGLVLYLPGRLLRIFGLTLLEWRSIHDWSALVLTVAVVTHLVLHRRRVAEMLLRLVRPAGPHRAGTAPIPSPAQAVPDGPDEQVAAPSPAQGRLRFSRRWFLVLAAGAVAAVIAALGLERGGMRTPGGSAASGSSGPLADFPVLNVEDGPSAAAAADWVLVVDGLVVDRLQFDLTAWRALPRTQETRTFHCVEGWSVDHLGWEGVRVADVLNLAKPQAGARFITFHAYGGTYVDSLPLAQAQAPETLLADSLDGAPLPRPHGGPLRLVIPSQLGYKNVKWVVRLEVTASQAQGYWEARGYPADAPA